MFFWIRLDYNVAHRPLLIAFFVTKLGFIVAITGLVRMVATGGYD